MMFIEHNNLLINLNRAEIIQLKLHAITVSFGVEKQKILSFNTEDEALHYYNEIKQLIHNSTNVITELEGYPIES